MFIVIFTSKNTDLKRIIVILNRDFSELKVTFPVEDIYQLLNLNIFK